MTLPKIDRDEMEKVEREGLCKEDSLDIFLTWYTFGGVNRGLSMTEILEMPLWLRKDMRFILGQMGIRRRERKAIDTARAEDTRKEKQKSSRRRR
jgi:hypothetical protein